jgi:nitrogen fixation NifU-like protein
MDDLYRDYILEHYRHPHNFGILENPDAQFEGANPLCGDRIAMMLKVRDGLISEVAFTGRGCAISQASASLLSDEIKGKSPGEVTVLGWTDMLELLGIEISPARLKCALLGLEVVRGALAQSEGGAGSPPAQPAFEDEVS